MNALLPIGKLYTEKQLTEQINVKYALWEADARLYRLFSMISLIASCNTRRTLRENLETLAKGEMGQGDLTDLANLLKARLGTLSDLSKRYLGSYGKNDDEAETVKLTQAICNSLMALEQGESVLIETLATQCNMACLLLSQLKAQRMENIGRPAGAGDPALDVLYRRALPIYRQYPRKWGKIAKSLWNEVNRLPENERSDDDRLVYDLWRFMPYKAQKEQLRNLWRSR
jgi:hypothetical protein